MGEDATGAAESTSKLRKQVLALAGVDVMKNANEYKGVYQILQEIARVWKDISDVDQAALLELLAGKNRSNILASLLNNFDDAEKALGDAMNAEGSALRENEKILESIQGKLNQFEAAWESLSNTIIDSNFLKWLVDSGTSLLKILDSVIEKSGTIFTLLSVGTGLGTYAFVDSDKKIDGSLLSNLKLELSGNDAKKTDMLRANAQKIKVSELEQVKKYWQAYHAADGQGHDATELAHAAAQKGFKGTTEAAAACAAQLEKYAYNSKEGLKIIEEYTNTLDKQIVSIQATTFATKALTVAKNMLASAAASVGVALIGMGITWIIDQIQESCISIDEMRESYSELTNELTSRIDNQDDINALINEFDELKNKTALSAEEFERYYEIQNELKNLWPELEGYYNAQGDFIIDETGYVNGLTDAYKALIAAKREDAEAEYNKKTLWGFGKSLYESERDEYNANKAHIDNLQQYIDWKREGIVPSWLEGKYYSEHQIDDELSNSMLINYDVTSVEEAVIKQKEYNAALKEFANNIANHAQNSLLSMGSIYADEDFNIDAANLVFNTMDTNDRIGLYETLQGTDSNAKQAAVDNLTSSTVYKEYASGKYDGMNDQLMSVVAEAGGLRKMNLMAAEYQRHQQEIVAGEYEFGSTLKESHLAGVTMYLAWVDAQAKEQEVLNGAIDVSVYSAHKDAVNSLGEAYVQFIEDGKVSLDTLSGLQETFGEYGDEWDALMDTVSSSDSTTADVKKSVEDLAEAYLEDKLALGEVNEENKAHIQAMLKQIGVSNAQTVTEKALRNVYYQEAIQRAINIAQENEHIQTTEEMQKAVLDECIALGMEANVAELVAVNIGENTAVKAASALNTDFLNATQEEIDKLIEEAIAANMTKSELAELFQMEQDRQTVLEAQKTGNWTPQAEAAEERLAAFQSKINDYKLEWKIDIDMTDAYNNAKDTADKVSEEFQKMYDELQYLRDANLISEEEYLARLLQLNEQFNKDNLEAYRKYQLEIFNGFKSMLSDRINKEADARIKALKKEREETEKYYDDLIEAEEEKLELLKKEWETEEYLLKIEQARAALQRAQQQKNVRVYREGQGFVWESDQEEIRNTRTEVNEAIQEYNRYLQELAIEKRIEELEKFKEAALDAIDEQIEAARLAKEEALKNIEELKFGMEAFLEFFEMFGVEVDENILAILENFDLLAKNNGLNDTKKSAENLLGTLQQLANSNIAGGTLNSVGAADAGNAMNNAQAGNYSAWLAEIKSAQDALKTSAEEYLTILSSTNEEAAKLLEGQLESWDNLFTEASVKLTTFQQEMLLLYPVWIESMGVEVSNKLRTIEERFAQFATTVNESFQVVIEQMNKMFVGAIEQQTGSGEEIFTWAEFYAYTIDTIIAKHQEWWDYLYSYLEWLAEQHQWLLDIINDEIDAFENWKNELFKQLDEVITKLDEVIEHAHAFHDELVSIMQQIPTDIEPSVSEAVGLIGQIQSALNGLQSKTIVITTIHRTVVENVDATPSKTAIETENANDAISPDHFASGVIGLSSNRWALTDEEGPELVIPGQGTFRKLKMGTSILPADISRNLWAIGQNPIGFASGIANMISNRKEENKTYQVNVGDIILHEVQNARRVADELKGLVLKAEQLAYSK